MLDLIIKNGTVIDGTGTRRFKSDIAVSSDKIVKIQENITEKAKTVIDATGLIVAPGFIESHGHTDIGGVEYPINKMDQGITTEIIGHCGFSNYPYTQSGREDVMKTLSYIGKPFCEEDLRRTYKEYCEKRKNNGLKYNFAGLVGFGTLRSEVIGVDNKEATKEDIDKMCELLDKELEQGAIGLSVGLIYLPQCFSKTEEVDALGKVLAKHNKVLVSHIRDEGDKLLEAIDEIINIAEKYNIKALISHIKAVYPRNWGKMKAALDKIEDARKRGVNVYADSYFYSCGTTTLMAALPKWATSGSITGVREKLNCKEDKDKITEFINENYKAIIPNLVVYKMTTDKLSKYNNMEIKEIAKDLNIECIEVVYEILQNEEATFMLMPIMSEDDILETVKTPFVFVGSDAMAHEDDSAPFANPRDFGTFPRFINKYVREMGVIELEEAINRMTKSTADFYNIKHRGSLEEGNFADIIIFDEEKIAEGNSMKEPVKFNKGIKYLLMNGEVQMKDHKHFKKNIGQVIQF